LGGGKGWVGVWGGGGEEGCEEGEGFGASYQLSLKLGPYILAVVYRLLNKTFYAC